MGNKKKDDDIKNMAHVIMHFSSLVYIYACLVSKKKYY